MKRSNTLGRLGRWAAVLIPIGVVLNVGFLVIGSGPDGPALATRYLAPPLGLGLSVWALSAARVVLWTRFVGLRVPLITAVRAVLSGIVGSAVTPTGSGGGLVKWALLTRRGVSPGTAASLLAVETVEEAVVIAAMMPIAVGVAAPEWARVSGAMAGSGAERAQHMLVGLGLAGLACATAVLLVAAGLHGRLGTRIRRRLRRAVVRVRATWRDARAVGSEVRRRGAVWFAVGVALAAAQLSARLSIAWWVVTGLGGEVSLILSGSLQWLALTLASLVPTPGGVGGAEAGFALVFGTVVPTGRLTAATGWWRLLMVYIPLGIASAALLAPWGKQSASLLDAHLGKRR